MEENIPTPTPTPPQPTPVEKTNSMAATPGMGRIVLISLGVLCLGLAIAYGGFFLGQKSKAPSSYVAPTNQPSTMPSPTEGLDTMNPTLMPDTKRYANTTYGYSLDYPLNLQVQGQGIQVTNETAPDVLFTTDITKASPNPSRVFFIMVQDKSLLTVKGQPMSNYTPLELATMDLQANVDNKNTYVATLNPVTKLQPLPAGITDGYTFTIRAKGYETVNGGALWDEGEYVMTEFTSAKYRYVLVYSNTDEMKRIVMTMQFTK